MIPKVSLVVPTLAKRRKKLNNLIASIDEAEYKSLEKIIIEDTGKGLAYNRNLGVKKARGKYILFCDDDNVVGKKMIGKLVKAMEENKNLIGAGPITYYKPDPDKLWFLSVSYNFLTSIPHFDKRIDKNKLIAKNLYKTQNLHNCFMVRKSIGDKIGWFDEEMYMSGTELDFFMRVRQKYYNMILATHLEAKCWHDTPIFSYNDLRSLGLTSKKRSFYFSRNRAILLGRYAKSWEKIFFGLFFYPLLTFFYSVLLIIKGRTDLMKPLLKGTVDGYRWLKL